jgi:hypothetical protein
MSLRKRKQLDPQVFDVLAVSTGSVVAALSKVPLDPKKVLIFLGNGNVFYSTNLDASGAFTLSGTGNKTVTWSVSSSGIDLSAAGFTVVVAHYEA